MEAKKDEEHQQQLLLEGDDEAQQQKKQEQDDVVDNNNNNSNTEANEDEDDEDDERSLDTQIEQKRRELDLLRKQRQQNKQEQSEEMKQYQDELDSTTKSLDQKLKEVKSSIQKITLLMKVAARQGGLGYGGKGDCTITTLVQDCLKQHYHKILNQSSLPPMYVMSKEVALISSLLITFKVLDNQIRIIQSNNECSLVPYLQQERNKISNDLDESNHQSLEKLSKIAEQNTACYDEFQLKLDAIEWERTATLKLLSSSSHHHTPDCTIIKGKDTTAIADDSTVPLSDEEDTERSGWDELVANSSQWLSSLPWAGGGDNNCDNNNNTNSNNSMNETSFHCYDDDEEFASEEVVVENPSESKKSLTNGDGDLNNSSNHFATFLNSSIGNIQKFTTTVTEEAATAAGNIGGGWLVGGQHQHQQQAQAQPSR